MIQNLNFKYTFIDNFKTKYVVCMTGLFFDNKINIDEQ